MADYARCRDRFLRNASSPCFFLNDHGRRLDGSAVRRTFYDLSRQTGLRGPEDHKGPRLHDFRHRFAVRTLVEWYRSNEDIERRLPVLSTFLGHGHVADTYWYLSVEPELMGLATRRLEFRWGTCGCGSHGAALTSCFRAQGELGSALRWRDLESATEMSIDITGHMKMDVTWRQESRATA